MVLRAPELLDTTLLPPPQRLVPRGEGLRGLCGSRDSNTLSGAQPQVVATRSEGRWVLGAVLTARGQGSLWLRPLAPLSGGPADPAPDCSLPGLIQQRAGAGWGPSRPLRGTDSAAAPLASPAPTPGRRRHLAGGLPSWGPRPPSDPAGRGPRSLQGRVRSGAHSPPPRRRRRPPQPRLHVGRLSQAAGREPGGGAGARPDPEAAPGSAAPARAAM